MNILTFSEKRPALAFSDYLRAQGIANHVQQGEDGFSICLEDPADLTRALAEAQGFVAHPDDPKYWQASWQTGRPQKEAVYSRTPGKAGAWWRRAGWVTRGVAILCVLVYVALLADGQRVFDLLKFPAAISVEAVRGQWWRLLTPVFIHGNELHIIFNLLWWWELAGLVEQAQSSWRLLALSMVIAVVSNAAQFLSYGPNFGGLSAVIYGLLGYLWLYPVADPRAPFRLRGVIVAFMLGWLALGYTGIFDALFGIAISNNGHLSGLLAGGGLGLLLGLVNYRRPAPDVEE